MNLTKTNNFKSSILVEITFTSEVGVKRLIHSLLVYEQSCLTYQVSIHLCLKRIVHKITQYAYGFWMFEIAIVFYKLISQLI